MRRPRCKVEEALAVLRAAGTDSRYKGLFESVKRFEWPTDRELARLPAVKDRPEDFRRWVADGEGSARDLEKVLRVPKGKAVDREAAERAYRLAGGVCTKCHAKYRDVPE